MNEAFTYSVDNFLTQLPTVLYDDPRMYALAFAIAKGFAVRFEELPLEQIYTRVDELPETLLDILAIDFKIDWYNFDFPVELKRNLVKTNYYIHRHLGTIGAVRTAIRAIYPQSDVAEWFDYDGEPYYFRIVLEATADVTPFSNLDILRAIYLYKSLRSHLEGIVFRSSINLVVKTGYGWATYRVRLTGTYPHRARQGVIVDPSLILETDTDDVPYRNPFTHELVAGTFPERAEEGMVVADEIVAHTQSGGDTYRSPYTDETSSGTYPDGEGSIYGAKYCGSPPGMF